MLSFEIEIEKRIFLLNHFQCRVLIRNLFRISTCLLDTHYPSSTKVLTLVGSVDKIRI